MVFHYDSSDPLAVVTAPPPDETLEEKAAREEREAEAQRISDQIDDELRADRLALKKEEQMVKILLLGQSESGKSTTLKNFRMHFASDKWAQERASWRAVLQLNLVHAVNTILKAMQDALNGGGSPEEDDQDADADSEDDPPLAFSEKHRLLRLRLRPLTGVESDLKRLLGIKTGDILEHSPPPTPWHSPRLSSSRCSQEFYVRSRHWRNFLQQASSSRVGDGADSNRTIQHGDGVRLQDMTEVISGCKHDIVALWKDGVVREMLRRYKVRLEDSASFFLDNTERLAARDYQPTDDDIVRARLRTLEIQEYELNVSQGADGGARTWKIYDVGGSRTQRNAWLPYFDQVHAIIFLAPISCFDERLQEDPRVNRLEDSFILWKAVCSSKLLSKTTLVIFLNKVDVLADKIARGTSVSRYLPSYGDRPNDTASVVKYLRQKFKDTVKRCSPEPRVCHIYSTSVIDTRTTAQTLISVRDGIIRAHLKRANLV